MSAKLSSDGVLVLGLVWLSLSVEQLVPWRYTEHLRMGVYTILYTI
ncbi:hypothetical protein EHLJMEHL_04950 [Vreelandella titanicae]